MAPNQSFKLVLAILAFAGAAWLAAGFLRERPALSAHTYFYDLSERKLFSGPRTAVPPIRGLNDAREDAVRAVVIATNGRPDEQAARVISYLEMYSPELKRQMEAAQATGIAPVMSRDLAQNHRFVRRPDEAQWHPMSSPEAEQIVSAWLTAGPDGGPAIICLP